LENLSASSSRIGEKRLPILGKYRLLAEIGHGGMAEVFLAVMEGPAKFSKLIALKMLRSQFAEDPEGREMFLNEARLAARLNHANVVQTYEVGEIDLRYYIAMEYLEGQPFSRILQRSRSGDHAKMPLALALRVIADSLSGLHYAHELKDFDGSHLNLVHRDISPHNVFVTYDGTVKVLDFGIAKAAGSSSETRTGVLKGKVGYMAPEQISDLALDRRVDLYATGVMIWEAVAGRKVWKGLSDVATLSKVATEGVPSLRTALPDVDPELERITMKACARSRDDRYDSAAELQADLEAYIEKLPDGGKATPRGIAKYIAEVFRDMREETKKLVESQLTKAKSIPPGASGSVAAFPLTATLGSGSITDIPISGTGPRDLQSASGHISVVTANPSPPKGNKIVLAIVAVAALAVVGLLAVRREKPAPAAAATNVTQPATPAAPSPAATATTIVVAVTATPPDAKVSIDGTLASGKPARGTIARDGKSHVVSVEAVGHAARTETFLADGDKSFTIALEKEAAPADPIKTVGISKGGKHPAKGATTAATATAAPPPPTPTATAAPTATSTSKKKIDEENPFN
jgi:serine/threonine protein kinase